MRKFSFNSIALRLITIGLGFTFASMSFEEPETSVKDSGSFFITSNPSTLPIGDVLKKLINAAASSVDVQIYALSDSTLINAINQKSKQFPISIYYDAKACPRLKEKLVDTTIAIPAPTKALMHRKICCLDKSLVLIGSANYTPSSLYWHYNLLVGVRSQTLAKFILEQKRGSVTFEKGRAFLLPDIKNQALFETIQKIDNTKNSIQLAMFSLTHPVLIEAMISAAARGVKIHLYCDKLNLKNINASFAELLQKCERVFTQKQPVLLHHKLCVLDKEVVITGSANWTRAGFKKNEEVLVIFDTLNKEELRPFEDLFMRLENELEPVMILQVEAA